MRSLRCGLSAFSFFVSVSAIQVACAGTAGAELAYAVDMFLVVKREDEAQVGEYRTRRMIV